MKRNIFYVALSCIVLLFAQCKKDDGGAVDPVPPTVTKDYLPLTTGSTFTYNDTTNGVASVYTITATSFTSTAFGRTYTKLTGSNSIDYYRAKAGAKYYQLISLPALNSSQFEDNYLKDSLPVNATWTVAFKIVNVLGFPDSLPTVATYKIVEKGITKTVNGKVYSDVIHVALTDIIAYSDTLLSSPLMVGIATGNFYYSLGVGLIQSNIAVADNSPNGINAANSSQTLTSYNIK